MKAKNLEQMLAAVGNPVRALRNSTIGAYVYPVVPAEFTNWREEQLAWRKTAALFDQSHHMAEIMVEGTDALHMLGGLTINRFSSFLINTAKQYVPCAPGGHVIGDVIVFRLAEEQFLLVGRAPVINWVQFHAETGGHRVAVIRDDRSPSRAGDKSVKRLRYRFQIQGPNATAILEKLNRGPVPDIRFFHIGEITIAGRKVRALRHGMARAPGLEIWGPYDEVDEVRAAIIKAGESFGMRQVGSRAYATNTLESGWIPSPLPAVYTGAMMKPYREWLPADGYEATASLGGSFVSDNIEDYYLTPYELGYGPFVKFDHDFIGREALEKIAATHRRRATFEWHPEDTTRVLASMFAPGDENYKFIDLPLSNYASSSYDRIVRTDGSIAGFSMFAGYSYNARRMLSLGVVDADVNEGDGLTLVWGEEDGGSHKTTVERHQQTDIRVRVSPTPYAQEARESYVGVSWCKR